LIQKGKDGLIQKLLEIDGTTTRNKMEFRMNKLDLVVVDMAGTTVQVTDQVPAAFQQAFHQAFHQVDVTLSDEEIRFVRGRSKREAIAYLLNRHLSLVDCQRLATAVYSDFQRILMERFEGQGIEPVDGDE